MIHNGHQQSTLSFDYSSDDAYKSGIISYRILQGNPSPLFLAVETNQCDTLDILLQMVGSCPKESLVSPQLTSDGMSVLDVAASKGYKTALEKLIRSGIFTRSETIKACKDYGHYALMRKYLASPLYLLTQRFPMFDDKCVENSPVKKGYAFYNNI